MDDVTKLQESVQFRARIYGELIKNRFTYWLISARNSNGPNGNMCGQGTGRDSPGNVELAFRAITMDISQMCNKSGMLSPSEEDEDEIYNSGKKREIYKTIFILNENQFLLIAIHVKSTTTRPPVTIGSRWHQHQVPITDRPISTSIYT